MNADRKSGSLVVACAIFVCLAGCGGEAVDSPENGIETVIRADAVQPDRQVDVTYEVGGITKQVADAAPGTTIDLGKVKPGTKVRLWVKNTNGAGAVRANILTQNCFRNTGSCDTPDCSAFAEYVVIEEPCIND